MNSGTIGKKLIELTRTELLSAICAAARARGMKEPDSEIFISYEMDMKTHDIVGVTIRSRIVPEEIERGARSHLRLIK